MSRVQNKTQFLPEAEGSRVQIKGVVESVKEFYSNTKTHYYDTGLRYITTVLVNEKDVVVYFNQISDNKTKEIAEKGDVVEFTATIKNKKFYTNGNKEIRQTVISRASKSTVTKLETA